MLKTPLYVLAGHYAEVLDFISTRGLSPNDVIYVVDADVLKTAPRGARYVEVGTFEKRPDAVRLRAVTTTLSMMEEKP